LGLADTVVRYYESFAGETVRLMPLAAEPESNGGFHYNTTSEFLVHAAGASTTDVAYFNRNNMVALTFHPTTQPATVAGVEVMAWFNGQGYHSVAEALGSVQAVVLSNMAPNVKLDFFNHPLPRSQQEKARDLVDDITGFVVSFCVLFGMAPLAASFTILFVNERRSKAKLLQYISGASPMTYWSSAFTWDFVNYLIPCMGCWALFAIFDVDAFSDGKNCGTVVLLFVSYGIAIIPLMYLFSLLFFDASAAFTRGFFRFVLL
jgi:ATP-binding cassette subfamily A (ABC1) protein 3